MPRSFDGHNRRAVLLEVTRDGKSDAGALVNPGAWLHTDRISGDQVSSSSREGREIRMAGWLFTVEDSPVPCNTRHISQETQKNMEYK